MRHSSFRISAGFALFSIPMAGFARLSIPMAGFALLFCLNVGFAAEEIFSIGSRRQLPLDDKFVRQSKGVEFVVHAPKKTGGRIISSEPGLSLGGYHSVLYDGGTYHLWYTAGSGVLYARSSDGIHWEKPNLNLLKEGGQSGGTVPGNLVLGMGLGGVKDGTHGLMVFIDPKASAAERFRLVANPHEFDSQLQIFSSPDGIRWKHTHTNVITFKTDVKPHHLDSQNAIFWDERIGKYVAYFRKNLRNSEAQGRTVARAESADLKYFCKAEDAPVVMQADPKHLVRSTSPKKGRLDLLDTYTNGSFKYPWAENVYLMFPTEYYHYGPQIAEFENQAPINAGALDTRFASSRDGINWRRYDHRPWVGLGLKGDFDSKRIYMVYGIVPALNEDELYMYYLGTSETHGWNRNDENNRLLTSADLAPTGLNSISRVVLRRDGFVSVRFEGDQLLLNVDTSASGELRVEILDENNQPIAGRTLTDCHLIHTANEINRVVRWKGESTVNALAGKPVRLHFVMRDVDLYAFQFAERGGI
jgi:hypothetical protein